MAKNTRRANGNADPLWNEQRQRYALFLELPRSEDGKRRRKKVSGKTKTEARQHAREVRQSVDATGEATDDSITVAVMMRGFLDAIPGTVSEGTLQIYRRADRLYITPALGREKVAHLQPRDVTLWLNSVRGGERSQALPRHTAPGARRAPSRAPVGAERGDDDPQRSPRSHRAPGAGPRTCSHSSWNRCGISSLRRRDTGTRQRSCSCSPRGSGPARRSASRGATSTSTTIRRCSRSASTSNVATVSAWCSTNPRPAARGGCSRSPRMAVDALRRRWVELNEERLLLGVELVRLAVHSSSQPVRPVDFDDLEALRAQEPGEGRAERTGALDADRGNIPKAAHPRQQRLR